jgi:hypothetical protein
MFIDFEARGHYLSIALKWLHFDMKETLDDLDWALGFWREERPAKPTTKTGKCAAVQGDLRIFGRSLERTC